MAAFSEKADKAADRRAGIREGSRRDTALDLAAAAKNKKPARVMHKVGGKGPMPAKRKK